MPQLSPTLATALETTVWTWLHRLSEATTRRWAAFAFAALVCIIAIALPQVLGIAHLAQFRFFYPAVLIAAYVSGRAGGLAATTFSAIWLTAGLFWNGARPGMGDLVSLAIFTGTALLISVATTDVGRREASRRTQVFIENTPAAVAMLDRDLRYLGASRRFIADFRLPFSNLEGRHHYEVFPEIPERWREACRRCLEVGTPGGAEEPFPRADGSIDFIRWEVRPWFTTARKIGGLLLFTELVTERRRESDRMVADKERLAATLRSLGDAVIATDANGRIDTFNPVAEALTGWPASEALGRPAGEIVQVHRDSPQREATDPLGQALRGRTQAQVSGPLLLRARDGTERPIVEHTTQMQDGGGRLAGAVLVMRDQTQERRYERALRESEERFRGLVEQALAGIYILGDSGFLYANPHLATIFRAPSPAAFMDRAPMDLVTPEHRERVWALTQRFFRGELDEVRYSFEGLRFDGTRCALEVQVRAVLFEGKRAAIGVLVDQTERDRVERELVESVARAQAIFDQAAAGMAEVDPQSGRFLRVNDRYCQMLGYTRDELLARGWVEVTHPEDRPPDGRAQPLAETYLRPTEKRYLHKDGSTVWATVHVAPLRSSSTSLAVVSDITKRKLAEAALRESESQLASLLRVAVTGHIISRLRDGKIIEVNDAWSGYLGWSREEVLGKTTEELGLYVDPEDRARIFERMSREGRLPPTEVRLRRRAGGEGTFLITAMRTDIGGEPCFVGAWNDVTHLRNLEEQFRQSQKLESIGRLAGGVAHDFNNLLTVIICSAEAMNDDLQQGSPVHAEDLQEVQAAADRARELTRQLLTFARKQVINPVVLDLNAVVRGSEKLLRRVLGEDVDLRVETQAGLWSMLGDQGQVEQVLMNLAVNARDAMPAGGQLLLETSNLDVPADECGGAPASQWVRLRVRDTGTGMSPEVKAHLFEPFFTTKEVGKGTGLGLATVHGIVLQAGGSISVESTIGQGTTFEIRLPRASADPVSPDAGEVPGVLSGTETLLVVEDDAQTRRVTVRTLEKAGYRVLVAGDGELALAVARAWTGALDLVVTDVVMPRMSGRALVDSLRWSRPGLRSLFVSGYSQEAISHRGVLDPGVQFLPKPFTPVALLTRVRAILDASRG